MAFLSQTPQQQVQDVITQTGENAQKAMMWFLVVAIVVVFIMFSGKKR